MDLEVVLIEGSFLRDSDLGGAHPIQLCVSILGSFEATRLFGDAVDRISIRARVRTLDVFLLYGNSLSRVSTTVTTSTTSITLSFRVDGSSCI